MRGLARRRGTGICQGLNILLCWVAHTHSRPATVVANHFSHFSPTIHVAVPAGALMVGKYTVIFAVCFCSFRRNAIRCGCRSLLHPATFHLRLYSFCSASFVAERPPCTNFYAQLCWNRSCGSKSNLAGFRISCLKGKRSVRHPSLICFTQKNMLDRMQDF